MSAVLVDTSAIVALLDRADPRHLDALSTFLGLVDERDLVTHGYVVAETIAVTRRRLGVETVMRLIDDVLPALTIVTVDTALHAEAQARYRASLPSGISFVDQVSFRVMERDGIDIAFALDADFQVAGVLVVPTQ